MCRHLGVGADPSCVARVTQGRAAAHRGAINHTTGPMQWGPQPRSSPAVTGHTGTLGCFGGDPDGGELETCPPWGNISSHFSLCGNPLSEEPTYRTLKSPEMAEVISWAAAPSGAACGGVVSSAETPSVSSNHRGTSPSLLSLWSCRHGRPNPRGTTGSLTGAHIGHRAST